MYTKTGGDRSKKIRRKKKNAVDPRAGMLFLLLMSFPVFISQGCAPVPAQLQEQIKKKDYARAVAKGNQYLNKSPSAQSASTVRMLVLEARYLQALRGDSGVQAKEKELGLVCEDTWDFISAKDSINYFKAFQEKFSKCSQTEDAYRREIDYSWKAANAEATWKKYRAFMDQYPNAARQGRLCGCLVLGAIQRRILPHPYR